MVFWLARIRAAKAELEAEARAAEAARPPPSNPDGSPKLRPGRTPKHEPGKPKPKAQRNFTDPESRIMKGGDGFIQAYNAQAAVDADADAKRRQAGSGHARQTPERRTSKPIPYPKYTVEPVFGHI